MPVLSRIVQAVSRGIRAIRRCAPEATVLLCDAVENFKTRTDSLQDEVHRRNLRRYLVMDLLLGKVDQYHPLHSWVTSYGMNELDLEWFRANPQSPDVFGLDYYPHSDWHLDVGPTGAIRQRRADTPAGLYNVANGYWQRYGIPMMLTETSIEGQPINREIWLEQNVEHIKRLREEGVPMLGLIWWPMLDQIDWDGAMTHRINKLHEVGLFKLTRQPDGTLVRSATPLIDLFRKLADQGDEAVGTLAEINYPSFEAEDEQLPPIGQWIQPSLVAIETDAAAVPLIKPKKKDLAAATGTRYGDGSAEGKRDRYGIVVFSHLRWGFVWQRPQQFLSRFAKKHPILFIEEPFFDKPEGTEAELQFHRVMPNVTVACPHCPASWAKSPDLPMKLRNWATEAIAVMNEDGEFNRPVLWYYSPMDASWSLGHFEHSGIVYDCMDELSQFTGAPRTLINNEARLMEHADIVFTGGYELWLKKKQQHDNVHFFGCGVEIEHFGKARLPETTIPPDIDFMNRPILGWFGVVDERVDYQMVGEMARMRPDWSFAMVGPVVKVDPNLLPHFPNLYWLGGRDYQVLPNYCKAFDINMMAFAINAATQYINPTKALEYLATGKPVIGTPVKDVVRQYTDLVSIVKTAEEFVEEAGRLLKDPKPERIARGIEKAKNSSWENTVKQMQDLIASAINKSERRSKKQIQPLAESELVYQFQHTQGS